MASETFFQDGQVVCLSDVYLKSVRNKKKRPLLGTLRGKVAECDDSSRDGCMYRVIWDDLTLAKAAGLHPDPDEHWYDSDSLADWRLHTPSGRRAAFKAAARTFIREWRKCGDAPDVHHEVNDVLAEAFDAEAGRG